MYLIEHCNNECSIKYGAVDTIEEAKIFCQEMELDRFHNEIPLKWDDEGSMTLIKGKLLFWCSDYEGREYYEGYWRISLMVP